MDQTFAYLFTSARPRQWLKNLSVFTGIVFSGWLFIYDLFQTVFLAFVSFCLLTSAVYIFNDILDISNDRQHPLKKHRPIASNRLPIPIALFCSIVLLVIGLWMAITISSFFFLLCLLYVILQFSYSVWLKYIAIIDVMAIATGFVLRVYAGAVSVNAHINVWLLLCVISFSLFLAIGKRRSERTLLEAKAKDSREVLSHYPNNVLNIYTSMFANTTWLTYALFTFQQPIFIRRGHLLSFMSLLPKAFVNQKLLMITIPFVIYGVMRYLQLIYEEAKGESPEEILLADKPLLTTIAIWAFLLIVIIYGIS